MPLYEYQCARCGRFEVIRKFSDSPLLTCPTCGGEVQKLLSAPAIQFKGTGWYITDYARKSGGEAASKAKDKEGGGAASGSKEGASKDGVASSSDSSASASKSGTSDAGGTSKGSGGGGGTTS